MTFYRTQCRTCIGFAKGLARTINTPELQAHIADMSRDLGRRGITKEQRLAKAAAAALRAANDQKKEVNPTA